jgi:hypothetical protein
VYSTRIDSPTASLQLSIFWISNCCKKKASQFDSQADFNAEGPVNRDINWLDVTVYAVKFSILSPSHQLKGR